MENSICMRSLCFCLEQKETAALNFSKPPKDKLIKRSLNNVAENITLSDPDRLLERINQDILKKSLDDKKKKGK
jgi:hypothetical protein